MKIIESIAAHSAGISAVRRDIHAHPELGFKEIRTADLVAEKLGEWGIPFHRGLGVTGIVGIVEGNNGGTNGRALGLRADMDALPIQEENSFAHASRHAGTMHACGHDGHVAMLLAAAQYLAKNRDFDGTVYLIFQPAEESGGGALQMMNDGLFEKFPMDAVFGMHNWPGIEVGKFAVSPGPVMAARSDFRIIIYGKGVHAATPHDGIDPIPIACQLVQAFQGVISRFKNPADPAVISVTMIHAGKVINVVPDTCEIQGTVRTFSNSVMDLIERHIKNITEHICMAFGTYSKLDFVRIYPATINQIEETELAASVMVDIVGTDNVIAQQPSMASEDFAYMLQAKLGCYCFIGNGDSGQDVPGASKSTATNSSALHNPSYDFNDELISLGATYWVRLTEAWLAAR